MERLAKALSTSVRTIQRDIEFLGSIDGDGYPFKIHRGNGGGVSLDMMGAWKSKHHNIFSREQNSAILSAISTADKHTAEVLRGLLKAYGSPNQSAEEM
jgi:predicted DNA-binding transcriptional regulator YafY